MNCINKALLMWVIFLWLPVPAIAQTEHPTVEVFTDKAISATPLPGVQTRYFNLDAPEQVKTKYLPALPPDPIKAKAMMQSFLTSDQGTLFQTEIREAYRGHQLMVQYQLEKIPAIVFDNGRYVVYGSTDIRHALSIYHAGVVEGRDE